MFSKLKISSRDISLMLTYAFIDAMAMQVYIDLFTSGFKITMSVVTLPVFLYFYRQINPIYQSFFIATVGLFIRSLFYVPSHGSLLHNLMIEYPTMAFDLTYGVLLYLFFYMQKDKSDSRWFTVILLSDFIANSVELIVRSGTFNSKTLDDMVVLMIIACIRAIISAIIIALTKSYRIILLKEEHSERYKNLLLLTAELKGETYFMKKNMDYIEDVMNCAYTLYEELGGMNLSKRVKNLPLNIAKDVHEIKKDYVRVIRGLEKIMGQRADDEDMQLSEFLEILVSTARKALPDELKDVHITSLNDRDFRIREHYLLMSVLRNLVVNAQEAMPPNKEGSISIWQYSEGDMAIFKVQDTGKGIKEQHVDHIFDPGFSTKFNVATGDISRGLGLTLVRDIIQERFEGTIEVTSEPGKGTAFTLKIPYSKLEVQ